MAVQIAGEQLLAGAGFAGNQHVAVGRRHLPRHFQQALHGRVLGDDLDLALVAFDLFAQIAVLALQADLLQRLGHHLAHLVEAERLGDVIEGAVLHGIHRRLQRGVAGDHDHFGVRPGFAALFQHLHAVHLLHAQIGQHHVEGLLLQQRQRVGAALRGRHLVALLLHDVLEVLQRDFFVVDDQ